jgi:hypothetical protein
MVNNEQIFMGKSNKEDYTTKDLGKVNKGENNFGYYNIGNYNTGDRNEGHDNSGDWNIGNWNSGDWNKTNHSSGCFNTKPQYMNFFNKPSDWTYMDWLSSEAQGVMFKISDRVLYEPNMTPQKAWNQLSETERNEVKSLPNFDENIFYECTGIDIKKEKQEKLDSSDTLFLLLLLETLLNADK